MSHIPVPSHLLKAFVAQGLVPDDCNTLEIALSAAAPLRLHYTVYLRSDHLSKLAAAFGEMDAALRVEAEAAQLERVFQRTAAHHDLLVRAHDLTQVLTNEAQRAVIRELVAVVEGLAP